jgi:hypothetical protein
MCKVCVDIKSIVVSKDGKPVESATFDKPFMFRLSSEHLADMMKQTTVACDALAEKFNSDPSRADAGRCHRKAPEDATTEVKLIFEKLVPASDLSKGDATPETLQKDLIVTTFAVAKSRITCATEAGHLGNFRLGMKGTRVVVAAKTAPLLEFLGKASGAQADLKQANQWLRFLRSLHNLTGQHLAQHMNYRHPVFHTSLPNLSWCCWCELCGCNN